MLKSQTIKIILALTLFGAATFFLVTGGASLNPLDFSWMHGNDPATHYLGWSFFRESEWEWPLGLNPRYGLDISSSIIFSDSIPLFALPLKLLHDILPRDFQYLGIWVLICFILQSLFAWSLIGLITNNSAIKFLSVGFFLFAPPLIVSIGWHTALVSHFLFLSAIYLCFNNNLRGRNFWWSALLGSSLLIQFYIFAPIFMLYVADYLFRAKDSNYLPCLFRKIVSFAVTCSLLLLAAWTSGYFAADSEAASAWGFGVYRANLFGFINPQGWSYLTDKLFTNSNPFEQLIFPGIGVIILFLLSAKNFFSTTSFASLKKNNFLIICLCFLVLYSLSNHVGIGSYEFTIPLPDYLLKIAGIFRASGRMFWPIYYLLLFLTLASVLKTYGSRNSIIILSITLIIQIVDTSAGWLPIKRSISPIQLDNRDVNIFTNATSPLDHPFWKYAPKHYQNIILYPLIDNQTQKLESATGWDWLRFATYSSDNKMGTNSVYLARAELNKIKSANDDFENQIFRREFNNKNLYIIDTQSIIPVALSMNPKLDLFAQIDGMNVFAPAWKSCVDCPQFLDLPDLGIQLSGIQRPKVGEIISFSKGKSSDVFLIGVGASVLTNSGWSWPEVWGVWLDGNYGKLVIPTPDTKWSKLMISIRPFISKSIESQKFKVSINKTHESSFTISKDDLISLENPGLSNKNFISIQFTPTNPTQPSSLGISDDVRRLSIGLSYLLFE